MTIKRAISNCISSMNLAETTLATYEQGLKRFWEYLCEHGVCDDSPLSDITIDHFINFYAWLGKRCAKSTAGVYSASAKAFLDHLVIHGHIAPSYQDSLRLEKARELSNKRRETRLPRFPEKRDAEKMILAAQQSDEPSPRRERNLALVLLLASTGCRISEVLSLKVKNLDMDNHTVIVVGKGSKERRVWFSPETAEAIRAYWKARGEAKPNQPVFARHDRRVSIHIKPMTTDAARFIVNDLRQKAGVEKFTPHYFRHAFAIKVLAETHDLAMVQDMLGHTNPASTRVYAKIYPEDLANAHHAIFG